MKITSWGLLGICFWREGSEAALGPERRGANAPSLGKLRRTRGGCGGNRGGDCGSSYANRRRSQSYGGQEASSYAKAPADKTEHRLVGALGLVTCGVPFLVEPVEARVVIRDPFLDGLPGWLDGLHSSLKLRMAGPFFADATNGRVDGEDQVHRSLLRAKAFPDAVLR